MSTVWNKLDEWKKKALVGLALISAVNVSAQRPTQYQEVPADQISRVLAERANRSGVVVTDVSQHPAYANREAYRQTGYDQGQVYNIDGVSCVYSHYYSSGINPYANSSEQLSGVYQDISNEDQYVLLYHRPDGSAKACRVSGTYLRDVYKMGRRGFYAHPDYQNNGYYGPNYNSGHHHGRHTRVREAARGVGQVLDGIVRIVNSAGGRR